MVMETPSSQCVGREFVRQYYTLLHEAPAHLHRFYSNKSSFVHGGVDRPPVTGQEEIHKKILSLNFRDCHTKIRQVDSQATVGEAVVVQVIGELSNNGMAMRRFMQTFVLVPQSPKKYYVHNDIFRYQDEVDTDPEDISDGIDSEQEVVDVVTSDDGQLAAGIFEQVAPAVMASSQPVAISQQQQHTGSRMAVKPQPPVSQPQMVPASHPQPISNGNHSGPVESGIPEPEEAPAEIEEEVPEVVPVSKESKPQQEPVVVPEPEYKEPTPKTWASMVGTGSRSTTYHATPNSVPVPKQNTQVAQPAKMDAKQDAPQPQQQRPPRASRERGNIQGGMRGDNEDIRRSAYPDNQQVFVGNLPQHISENDLRDFFQDFGKVVELRINKKPGGSSIPNYGFVVFDDEKTTQLILKKEGGFHLRGGHRLNVEEKKQRGEAGRPGSNSRQAGGRGGGANMSRGGGGLSGGRGGRGGMMVPPGGRSQTGGPRGGGGGNSAGGPNYPVSRR